MSTTNTAPLAQRGPDGLAIIGATRHQLMGIRHEQGEGGAAPAVPTPPAAPPAVEAPKPPWGDDPSKFDPDKAWNLIQNVKTDLATEKQKREEAIAEAIKKASEETQKATLAQFAKLLTGEGEPETDPAKLNDALAALKGQVAEKDTNLTKAQSDAKAAARDLQVAILAPSLGANTKLLLANEQFKTSIAAAEPTDEAAITAAIQKAVQDTPTLKATSPRSGGGEHQGATVQTLEAQLAKAVESKNLTETIRLRRAIAAAKA